MARESALSLVYPGRTQTREGELAELARRQHGVVARQQLEAHGIGAGAIEHRMTLARLHPLHAGVYAVGHGAVGAKGKWMAAVLAAGDGAVLSHRSAACFWGLLKEDSLSPEVTAACKTRSTPHLLRHFSRLREDEAVLRDGIPVTCVARTLLDIAPVLPRYGFERAVREAEVLDLPRRPSLLELYRRHPRRRGARTVRHTLEALALLPGGQSRSALEDRFLRFLRRCSLPLPEQNVWLDVGPRRYQADCLWRARRVIVELDGRRAHGTRSAFEHDRERDRRMLAEGWSVIRITWRQLTDQPEAVAADLRRLLLHESAISPASQG